MAEYINREDIIKWIDDSLEMCGDRYSVDQENMMELFRTVINDCLPFADVVERKRGKWIYQFHEDEVGATCSECEGYAESFAKWIYDDGYRINYNYCPNCGADMRKLPKESE